VLMQIPPRFEDAVNLRDGLMGIGDMFQDLIDDDNVATFVLVPGKILDVHFRIIRGNFDGVFWSQPTGHHSIASSKLDDARVFGKLCLLQFLFDESIVGVAMKVKVGEFTRTKRERVEQCTKSLTDQPGIAGDEFLSEQEFAVHKKYKYRESLKRNGLLGEYNRWVVNVVGQTRCQRWILVVSGSGWFYLFGYEGLLCHLALSAKVQRYPSSGCFSTIDFSRV